MAWELLLPYNMTRLRSYYIESGRVDIRDAESLPAGSGIRPHSPSCSPFFFPRSYFLASI
ncbi:hypothetical protein [Thermococcus thioreducens]|uniref:hypothetical protein n=1 Tax=Thermococcus thioreducens TaxID=277988 RepID=UPI000AD4F350|nr:hypothetical protein [Thermococcus thioreducens]